jgi:integrase
MNAKLKYMSQERSGLLFYFRRIPADLQHHYSGKALRRVSLRTHDPAFAATEAMKLAKADNQIWAQLRNGARDVDAAIAYIAEISEPVILHSILAKHFPKQHHFSEALDVYLRKHQGRGDRFIQNAKRAFSTAQDILGNPALKDIKRADARKVLESMLKAGLRTSSVKRYLNTLCAIMSTAILELELNQKNPFAAMTIPNYLQDVKDVSSFNEDELCQIATEGLAQKTEPGLIATMQIELGARVSEIALLQTADLHLDVEIPFVTIKEHLETGRTLKTGKKSERVLPLVGVSLSAARLARASAKDSGWLFPMIGKRNPQSTVNRWLIRTIGEGAGRSHSARRSMETRLVLAGIDQRIVDTVMGHAPQAKMGSVYFQGFSLADLAGAMKKIAIPLKEAGLI